LQARDYENGNGDYENGNGDKRRISQLTQFMHATLQLLSECITTPVCLNAAGYCRMPQSAASFHNILLECERRNTAI